ncbi:MAG: GNAT family acetyltransferase [Polaromonas sp.]|nr:GNAT family acetyltransferase [Polaromonas sp.]
MDAKNASMSRWAMRLMKGGGVGIGAGNKRRHASIALRATRLEVCCGKVPSLKPDSLPAMNQIIVLPFDNATHRNQVVDVWLASFGYDTAHNEPGLVIDTKLAVNDELFYVAVDGLEVVGTVMAGYDGHRGWLYSVSVQPSHRKRGVGALLVMHAERSLAALGCLKINLQIIQSNAALAPFYAALGYRIEPRVSMGKLLPENLPPA